MKKFYNLLFQVPDHQEVYVDKNTEMSFIIELLSYEETVADEGAAMHFFTDLAHCNEVDTRLIELFDFLLFLKNFIVLIRRVIYVSIATKLSEILISFLKCDPHLLDAS